MATTTALFTEKDYATDLPDIFEAVDELLALERELNSLFPEREFLIRQMVLSVLMRMNILIYGTYGTGKSLLIRQFIECLGVDANEVFAIELTRFTTEADVFGPIDVPLMRDQGIQRRNPAGTIRGALYAEVDEIFDAEQLMRSLLGVLHERFYRRGADSGPVPLRSAIASTNVNPGDLVKRFPNLDAVVDRFLFQCNVHWLEADDGLLSMFESFLRGKTPTTRVDHGKLLLASTLITDPTDQIDLELLGPFLEIVKAVLAAWKNKGWRRFSDRSICLWLVALEANAILNKRYKVSPVDFRVLKHVVCSGDPDQLAAFEAATGDIVEQAIQDHQAMSIDDAVLMAIEAVRSDWPNEPDATTTSSELVYMRRKFTAHRRTAATMGPQLPATQALVRELTRDIDARASELDALIIGS